MKIFYYSNTLSAYLLAQKSNIAFVPTMGALHAGHVSLCQNARKNCDILVASIFVNPLQFNKAEDLAKYPRTISADLQMLENAGVDVVFLPEYADLYAAEIVDFPNAGPLDLVYEGTNRPGHFAGVLRVLHRFFSIVQPNAVYFGIKDLQQCLVVEKLIATHFPNILQINCPTQREPDGLAMSSRNLRLGAHGREVAPYIYRELQKLAGIEGVLQSAIQQSIALLNSFAITTEYLALVNLPNLDTVDQMDRKKRQALIFAGYVDDVRLIDNIVLPIIP